MRGSGDKFREAVAQGAGDDELRGAVRGTHGAQPGADVAPDQSRVEGGEALEQALGDEADLDVAVIGGEFSADGRAVGRGLVMEELVACRKRAGWVKLALRLRLRNRSRSARWRNTRAGHGWRK